MTNPHWRQAVALAIARKVAADTFIGGFARIRHAGGIGGADVCEVGSHDGTTEYVLGRGADFRTAFYCATNPKSGGLGEEYEAAKHDAPPAL